MFAELQKTLVGMKGASGSANLQSTENLPEAERLVHERNVAQDAIKTIVQSNQQASNMHQENSSLKRRHEDIGAALTGFGGVSAARDIPVRASASNPAAPSTKHEDFSTWRANNPSALWRDVNKAFHGFMSQQTVNATGVVNASKNGPWSRSSLDVDTQGQDLPECCHAGALHPELFACIQDMNTGRMIGGSETISMMQSINTETKKRRF